LLGAAFLPPGEASAVNGRTRFELAIGRGKVRNKCLKHFFQAERILAIRAGQSGEERKADLVQYWVVRYLSC
jgi:hypothetical protein